MSTKFQRKKENFTCLNCNAKTAGNGYTNHCPKCLWSRHVDINPGDRKAKCSGMMKPVRMETENSIFSILHKCIKCGVEKRNKISENDDLENYFKALEASK